MPWEGWRHGSWNAWQNHVGGLHTRRATKAFIDWLIDWLIQRIYLFVMFISHVVVSVVRVCVFSVFIPLGYLALFTTILAIIVRFRRFTVVLGHFVFFSDSVCWSQESNAEDLSKRFVAVRSVLSQWHGQRLVSFRYICLCNCVVVLWGS